jgi:uncharacterized protein affecting Mg2+/Co2+ transport
MVEDIPSFVFCYKFYLIIKNIKAKFVNGESKYVFGYRKIIQNLNSKCNSHIQVHFKITNR